MTDGVRHPLFARFFDRLSRVMEPELGPRRSELLSGLNGRVLELGAGNGINFTHYPPEVQEVIALEPEPYMRRRAERAAAAAPVPVSVRSGIAEGLPFPDSSFDAVVACLVLCTVPHQAVALRELRRVLAPDGQLRFLEHVRASRPGKARVQSALDRSGTWPLLGGGCHCSRDTVAGLEAAGFRVGEARRINLGPGWMITNPHVLGRATPA